MKRKGWGPMTRALHAGESLATETGDVVTPIHQSATFAYPERPTPSGAWKPSDWIYTRYSNPTVAAVEEKMAALEDADHSFAFASGMGAMAAAVFSHAQSGDRVSGMSAVYGGTRSLLAEQAPRMGLRVDLQPSTDAGILADAVDEATRVVVTELPNNPLSRILDLPDLAQRLSSRWGRGRPMVVADATFATPLNLQPLARGADLSVHSATKYLNGHSDVIAGFVSGRAKVVAACERWRRNVGACIDPHSAFLLARGMKTLGPRLRAAERNARVLAEFLERDRRVSTTWHLSLKSHPDHRTGRRLLKGPGAVLAFQPRATRRSSARRLLRALRVILPAASLGGVESLASLPVESSHKSVPAGERRAMGITESTIRLAVGVEDVDDLVEDVRNGLRAL